MKRLALLLLTICSAASAEDLTVEIYNVTSEHYSVGYRIHFTVEMTGVSPGHVAEIRAYWGTKHDYDPIKFVNITATTEGTHTENSVLPVIIQPPGITPRPTWISATIIPLQPKYFFVPVPTGGGGPGM